MSTALRRSALAAAVLLALLGLLTADGGRELTPTTFGTSPTGYGALFDLLSALQLPVVRTYVPPDELPGAATVWWIEAPGLCGPRRAPHGAGTPTEEGPWWSVRPWVEGGGTAVIFLPPELRGGCASVAGVRLPPRVAAASPSAAETGGPPSGAWQVPTVDPAMRVEQTLSGPLVAEPRQLTTSGLRTFKRGNDWQVVAALDGRPFVLETSLGSGRVVVVADATVVRNAWLDRADAAVLAVDVVRAYGVPRFDERAHGLRAEGNAVRYLLASAALPLFVGLALLAALYAWRGAAVPARSLPAAGAAAPALETFVDSLARLYAASQDHTRVLQHYRALTAARLRRHFRVPPDTPIEAVAERVRGTGRVSAEAMRWLAGDVTISGESELRAAVGALDRLLWEATA